MKSFQRMQKVRVWTAAPNEESICNRWQYSLKIQVHYRAFRFKNELLFKRFSLLTKSFFTSVRWCAQESLSSKVMPRRRVCFTHSIRSSPIVTELRGPICGFLIRSIASHLAEWGVKEFSWHQPFSSDKALSDEVTLLSAVSPMH